MRAPRLFFGELCADLVELTVQAGDFRFDLLAQICGALAIDLPDIQAQDAAQDALAVARSLLGELVGFALQEEGCVDEGLIVQAQGLLDAQLGLAQGALGQRLPGRLASDLRRPGCLICRMWNSSTAVLSRGLLRRTR